jgi:hypothetical protein
VKINISPIMATKNQDTAVIPADTQEFRKANEIIAPRVARGGTLSLLGRKVFNVLLYHTQRLGVPGLGAPEGDAVYQTLYWLPLSELAKDSAFNSEDTGLLKETLLKLQDIKIITDDAKGFSSDVLVASVKIVPGKRGQKTMLGWGLHPATEAILRSPEFYTRLSIYYLTSLRTTAGIALYENCKRYATNPSKLTRREAWEWWHDVLTGQPIGSDKPEYKYFKRDVLKPAIAEVCTTDIQVEMIEHKAGRRVVELQFKVERASQGTLELPPPPVIDTQVIARITSLGIHDREAGDIFASNEEGYLRATLDLVEVRAADQKLPPLGSPAAFFRTALRSRFADGQKQRVLAKPASPEKPAIVEPPIDPVISKARKTALKIYDASPDVERQAQLEIFLSENPAFVVFVRKSPSSRVVREALGQWLAEKSQ